MIRALTSRSQSQLLRRELGTIAAILTIVLLLLATSEIPCHAALFEGYAQVGSKVFDISFEVTKSDDGSFWVACALTQDGMLISRMGIELSDSGVTARTEGGPTEVSKSLGDFWRLQLRSKFLDLLDSGESLLSTGPNGAVTCESRRPITLTDALVGKLKLTYQAVHQLAQGDFTIQGLRENPEKLELIEIQAYSLDEWLNGFGERVILSLKRNRGASGGQPW